MPISPQRLAALLAVALAPVAVLLAILLLPFSSARHGLAKSPLEGAVRIGRTHGWIDFSGFHPAELEAERPFNWMSATGRLRLLRLDRTDPLTLSLWVQPAVTNRPVDLTVTTDGATLPPRRLAPGSQQIDIALPPSDTTRAVIGLAVSEALVPGGSDTRTLGMRVDGIALTPGGGSLRVPPASRLEAVVTGLSLGAIVAMMLGVRRLAFATGIAIAGWIGFLLVYDGAFLGPYPDRVQGIGIACAMAAALLTLATPGSRDRWGFRAAACVAVAVTACKLALFFHPMATVGDSIFHVHRAQLVQRGEYFFTSITPRPYFEFPYPPGLYVAAGPLWEAFRSETEHVWLLRTIVLAAEALLALALYGVVMANWKNRLAAFLTSAITLLLPVGFFTICTSNLTNSFGQSIFGIGVAALLCAHLRPERRWWFVAAGTVLACAGFLSHFSTFSVGVPLLFVCAAAVFLGGPGPPRRAALALLLALVIASTASVALYYAHFMPVYKRTAERVLAREGEGEQRSMVAPPALKAERAATTVWAEFGAGVLIAGVVAGALLLRRRARDPLTLALAGWAAVVVGFWVLGIVTAIEMRASLAAEPLAAMLAACAIARGIETRNVYRIAAAAALASILLHAVSDWITCLGVEPFWRA